MPNGHAIIFGRPVGNRAQIAGKRGIEERDFGGAGVETDGDVVRRLCRGGLG